MQEMVIYGVSFDMVGKQPIVLLKTRDGNKFLPIWIGHPEAAAILMKLQGANTPRPMTHDLISEMLSELDVSCTRVAVTELRENTFYAEVTLQLNGREIPIDSRPSDALALAVRTGAPIFAAEDVISESAIEFEHEVHPREGLAAQELIGPQGELLRPLGRVAGQLGGAHEARPADLVAGLEVVELLALRHRLHHRQRLAVEDRDGQVATLHVALEQDLRVVRERGHQRGRHVRGRACELDAERRALARRLDHDREVEPVLDRAQRLRGPELPEGGVVERVEVRRRYPAFDHQVLGQHLVH